MYQTAHTPKSTPLPQLRSKCKLTQKVLSEPCPEFERVQQVLGTKEIKISNASEATAFVAEQEAKRNDAIQVYFQDNSLANFKKLIDATAAYDRAQSAYNQVVVIQSGAMTEWMKGDEVREATLAALRVVQKRLAKKISELNDEERKRMEEAGLDPSGEHPAITGLKLHLSSVAEAIIRLQDGGAFNWNEYSNLFQS